MGNERKLVTSVENVSIGDSVEVVWSNGNIRTGVVIDQYVVSGIFKARNGDDFEFDVTKQTVYLIHDLVAA